jgi:hypothetical protein
MDNTQPVGTTLKARAQKVSQEQDVKYREKIASKYNLEEWDSLTSMERLSIIIDDKAKGNK